MAKLGKRVYKTTDGRFVLEGDPAAAYLAYSQYDDVPDKLADQLAPKRAKSRSKPTDKAVSKSDDK